MKQNYFIMKKVNLYLIFGVMYEFIITYDFFQQVTQLPLNYLLNFEIQLSYIEN